MPEQQDKKDKGTFVGVQLAMVLLFLVTAVVIGVWGPGTPTERLTMSIGYGLLVLTFLFGMVIIVDIIRGNIDLSTLLTEDGKASMSRFQLLIFTFVIALSIFLMVASNPSGAKFPEIPSNVLALLGISASTYAVSKGIQAGSNGGGAKGGKGDDAQGGQANNADQGQ
jgi:hypothetical protein